MTDDEIKTISSAPPDADGDFAEPAGERLAGLAAEVERRERELERRAWELAADRAYRPPLRRRFASWVMLLVTVAIALLAGNFAALALLGLADDRDVYFRIEAVWSGPVHYYTLAGPVGELIIATVLALLASSANRARKRLIRRPRVHED